MQKRAQEESLKWNLSNIKPHSIRTIVTWHIVEKTMSNRRTCFAQVLTWLHPTVCQRSMFRPKWVDVTFHRTVWIQDYHTAQTANCALERNKFKLNYLRLCQRGASVKSENQFRPSTLVQLNTAFIELGRERFLCFVGRILNCLGLSMHT